MSQRLTYVYLIDRYNRTWKVFDMIVYSNSFVTNGHHYQAALPGDHPNKACMFLIGHKDADWTFRM